MAFILDQQHTTNNGSLAVGNGTFTHYAQQFTLGVSSIVNQIEPLVLRNGTGGDPFSVSIYTDNGSDSPGERISDITSWNVSAVSTIALEYTAIAINNCLGKTAGTKLWVVLTRANLDAVNYLAWGWDTAGGYSGGVFKRSNDNGSSWILFSGRDMNFKEYYGETYSSFATRPRDLYIKISL